MSQASAPVGIVIVGHVDHGKSTFIGRLLHETGSLADGKVDELIETSRRRGVPMEWSFVLDSLQAERDQAVTIDTTRIWFTYDDRRYAIIDAPGHREFVRNMLSGASEADAAILIVDVTEGVSEQTRRHANLLRILGIKQLVIAVNKMDAVKYSHERFRAVAQEAEDHLRSLGLSASATIPISARDGENLIKRSERTPWYEGRTIIEAASAFRAAVPQVDGPLRMRVQDVYRQDSVRIAVGRLESGTISVGNTIVIAPTRTRATIESIKRWPHDDRTVASAGESIGITLEEPAFIERGDVISHESHAPHIVSQAKGAFFWLDARGPEEGEVLRLEFGPSRTEVVVASIDRVVDSETLLELGNEVPQYAVVDLTLRSNALMALDTALEHTLTSRGVLLRGRDVVAGGVIVDVAARSAQASNIHPYQHLVTREERAVRNAHAGIVLWLTGLSGSGKSTIAMAVERRLFARGFSVYVLDGDNVRSGLNGDLGFSPEDRAENIRRIGEVAALFADAGTVVIAAFISPFARDRERARAAAGTAFHEVYIRADLQTCESRDPKGLYLRARRGEIAEFTGVSAPYEAPTTPELVIDTASAAIDECVERVVNYVADVSTLREPTPIPG